MHYFIFMSFIVIFPCAPYGRHILSFFFNFVKLGCFHLEEFVDKGLRHKLRVKFLVDSSWGFLQFCWIYRDSLLWLKRMPPQSLSQIKLYKIIKYYYIKAKFLKHDLKLIAWIANVHECHHCHPAVILSMQFTVYFFPVNALWRSNETLFREEICSENPLQSVLWPWLVK